MTEEHSVTAQNASEDISVDTDWQPNQNKWPRLIALFFVAAVGFGAWKLFFDVKLDPTKILIVVQTENADGTKGKWWGANGKVSARYADAMAERLEKLGFQTYSGADPEFLSAMEATNSLDDIVDLAASKGIYWILKGTVQAAQTMPIKGDDDERVDIVITTDLTLINTDEGPSDYYPSGPSLMSRHFFLKWQTDFESALEKHNAGLLVNQHIADVARTLATTEVLAPYSSTEQETTEATVVASKLQPLFQLSRRYELALDARNKRLKEDEEELLKQRPTASSTLSTPLDVSEAFVGETADGGMITQTESRETFFSPKLGQFLSNKTTDELVLTSRDGIRRKSLFRTYNIFSHPQISRDGRWVGVVVDHHDRGTSIVRVSTADGKVEELLFTKRDYISDVSPSPDGSQMVYWSGACARCDKGVNVISIGSEAPLQVLSPQDASTTRMLPEWSADGTKLFFSSEREGYMRSVWSVTVPALTFTPVLGNALPSADHRKTENEATEKSSATDTQQDERQKGDEADEIIDRDPPEFTLEDVSADGASLLLVEKRDAGGVKTRHLVTLELQSGKTTELTQLHARDERARYSPTGQRIAFRTKANTNQGDTGRFDWEIGTFDLKTNELATLTANQENEFFLSFAHRTNRIYFHIEQRHHRGPCGKHCRRILWTEP